MFYLYILKSKKSSSYYVGSCKNVSKRIDLHNRGLVKSTKRYCPWEVVYTEECKNLNDAQQRETKIKSWKKRKAIEELINTPKF